MHRSSTTRRFGDYSFDPASGDLSGAAGVTRLPSQVAALLTLLTERPGEVVTRAELQTHLWPNTTVEFDDGLNSCVRQLRVALNDDANSPRYIETLPKRGYRFLAAVTLAGTAPSTPVSAPDSPIVNAKSRPQTRHVLIGALLCVFVAAGIMFVRAQRQRGRGDRAVSSQRTISILPFAADTTDPMVATYRQRLLDQIGRDARADSTLTLVGSTGAAATYVLSGSLTRNGNSVKLFVQLTAAGDRRKLWADDITDSYAFSGNSTMTADRIAKSIARILRDSVSP